MPINTNDYTACNNFVDAMKNSLKASGFNVQQEIDNKVFPIFIANDQDIFNGLCRAILSAQADDNKVQALLPELRRKLFYFNIGKLSTLTEIQIAHIYKTHFKGHGTRLLLPQLRSFPSNACRFQQIAQTHGSVWSFIQNHIDSNFYDSNSQRYIQPNDKNIINKFTVNTSPYKLNQVGLAICCEFFNNIGIDEFKPDALIKRVYQRNGLNTQTDAKARETGITISQTLNQSRKYLDNLSWHFGREICKESKPLCHLCALQSTTCVFRGSHNNQPAIYNMTINNSGGQTNMSNLIPSTFNGVGKINANYDNWEISIGNKTNENFIRSYYNESTQRTGDKAKLFIRLKPIPYDVALHIYLGNPKNPTDTRRKYPNSYIGKPASAAPKYLNNILQSNGFTLGQTININFNGINLTIPPSPSSPTPTPTPILPRAS